MSKHTPAALLFCTCASLLSTTQATSTLIGQVGMQVVIGAGCAVISGDVNGGINQWGTLDLDSHPDFISMVDIQTVGTSGNIQIQCDTSPAPSLTVNAGLHVSGSQCYMQNTTTTAGTIAYNIYSDAAHSALIQVNTPVDISSVPTGTAVNIPLYGRVMPIGRSTPTPATGTYTDIPLITIAW